MLLKTKIPFTGFYETWPGALVEDVVANINTDAEGLDMDEGNEAFIPDDIINYSKAHIFVAKAFTRLLQDYIRDEDETNVTLVFTQLFSPRYYNYVNDSIEVDISVDDLEELHIASVAAGTWDKYLETNEIDDYFQHDPLGTWTFEQLSYIFEATPCIHDYDHEAYPFELSLLQQKSEVEEDLENLILENLTDTIEYLAEVYINKCDIKLMKSLIADHDHDIDDFLEHLAKLGDGLHEISRITDIWYN
jgi:hypothetical protein